MSPEYRLMSYFVAATLHMYRADISPSVRADMDADPRGKTEWFVRQHPLLVQRIVGEGINLFEYYLSHRQVCNGVYAYFAKAQSVEDSKPATLAVMEV